MVRKVAQIEPDLTITGLKEVHLIEEIPPIPIDVDYLNMSDATIEQLARLLKTCTVSGGGEIFAIDEIRMVRRKFLRMTSV